MAVDRLAPILEHLRVRTHLLDAGAVCETQRYDAAPGHGHLHVLRSGEATVTQLDAAGRKQRRTVSEPSLLFYPRAMDHAFHVTPGATIQLACASLDFEGGTAHPLVRTLPDVIIVPLAAAGSLGPALELLFAEVDDVRCGRRIVADRLFEIVLIQLFRWIMEHAAELALPDGLVPGLADERLAPVLVAIHEAPAATWSLESMARTASMSRSSFAARFRTVVGQTPADYLADWRVTVAQRHLLAGTSVARTALDVGYGTQPAFTRAFTQRVGRSPRAWLADAR